MRIVQWFGAAAIGLATVSGCSPDRPTPADPGSAGASAGGESAGTPKGVGRLPKVK